MGEEVTFTLANMANLLSRKCHWEIKTMSKGSRLEIRAVESRTEESMFKIIRSNKKVYGRWSVGERAPTACLTPTIKQERCSVMVCGHEWGLLPIAKSGICTRWRANSVRQAIKEYCSIRQSHQERGVLLKDLYPCKIITQNILVNLARGALKAKRNSMSIN